MEYRNNSSECQYEPVENDWALPCVACGHLKMFHVISDDGDCLADLHRTQALWHDSGFGGRCWCSAFTSDPVAASLEILTHGDPAALRRGIDEALDRRDLEYVKRFRTKFIRKTPKAERDDVWLEDVTRQIDELTKSAGKLAAPGFVAEQSPDIWGNLRLEFETLAEEELHGDPGNRSGRWLRAYSDESGKRWRLSDGLNEGFHARVELVATRAGHALVPRKGETKLNHWLYRLYLELAKNRSKRLFAPVGYTVKTRKDGKQLRRETKGGIILSVCEASAWYCTRLGREALEKAPETKATSEAVLLPSSPLLRKYRSRVKRAIVVVLGQRPDATDIQICRSLDADDIDLPRAWRRKTEDRLFVDAYRDSARRNKVESTISKVRADFRKKGLL